jgi:SHS2 domain-containing protein
MSGVPGARGHTVVEHTADSAIEAWAEELAGLFEECAAAMFELMYRPNTPSPAPDIAVEAMGDTTEDLLVAWLSELLYVAEVDDLALCGFVVDAMAPGRVEGRAAGLPAAAMSPSGPPIKAVTYHGLDITHDGSWRARVIFDV